MSTTEIEGYKPPPVETLGFPDGSYCLVCACGCGQVLGMESGVGLSPEEHQYMRNEIMAVAIPGAAYH